MKVKCLLTSAPLTDGSPCMLVPEIRLLPVTRFTASETAQCPEPLCLTPGVTVLSGSRRVRPGRALPLRLRSYGLMRPAKLLPSLSTKLIRGSLQVVVSPCWRMVVPDMIPVILTEAPGPLPRSVLPVRLLDSSQKATAAHPQIGRFAHWISLPCNFYRGYLSRLQSFAHVPAPTFARPAGCTHPRAGARDGQAVYTTHFSVGCLPRVVHHYVFDRATNTTGLSPAGSQNCRLLHLGGTLIAAAEVRPGHGNQRRRRRAGYRRPGPRHATLD